MSERKSLFPSGLWPFRSAGKQPTTLDELFTQERDRYVKYLVGARDFSTAKAPKSASELLIRINTETIDRPYSYIRVDFIYKTAVDKDQMSEFRGDIPRKFAAANYENGQAIISVEPFSWDSIQLAFNHAVENIEAFKQLITYWLDLEDSFPKHPQNISQAIHSFTPIEHSGGWWYATGDFGTAPIEALQQFIGFLSEQGATRIIVRSGRNEK